MRLMSVVAENFMRLKVVRIRPEGAVTKIIGENEAGKTSCLDAIMAAIAGKDYCPVKPIRDGEKTAEVTVDLGNMIATRKWWYDKHEELKTSLVLKTPDGAKFDQGQTRLDALIGKISFDPLSFERMKAPEQAATLAAIAGVNLEDFKAQKTRLKAELAATKKAVEAVRISLEAMPPKNAELPDEPYSATKIVADLAKIDEHNRGVEKLNSQAEQLYRLISAEEENLVSVNARLEKARAEVLRIEGQVKAVESSIELAKSKHEEFTKTNSFKLEDPTALREKLANMESVNAAIRANQARAAKAEDGNRLIAEVTSIEGKIEAAETLKNAKITNANLPVEGLSLTETGVEINNIPFEQCSGAQRLTVSVALAIALNPKLKLMLIRDGSLLDAKRMQLLDDMATAADAQVLIERVDNGTETGIMIVDGETVGDPVYDSAAESEVKS